MPFFLLGSLREVKLELYELVKQRGIKLIPGKKLCSNCFSKMNAPTDPVSAETVAIDVIDEDVAAIERIMSKEGEKASIDACLNLLDVSPMKLHGQPCSSRISLGKRKIDSAWKS